MKDYERFSEADELKRVFLSDSEYMHDEIQNWEDLKIDYLVNTNLKESLPSIMRQGGGGFEIRGYSFHHIMI
jgi:hypothetical protein